MTEYNPDYCTNCGNEIKDTQKSVPLTSVSMKWFCDEKCRHEYKEETKGKRSTGMGKSIGMGIFRRD